MDASQKEQLFGNLAEAMQDVPERIIARQLVHFYKVDPDYGSGVAKKLAWIWRNTPPGRNSPWLS